MLLCRYGHDLLKGATGTASAPELPKAPPAQLVKPDSGHLMPALEWHGFAAAAGSTNCATLAGADAPDLEGKLAG